MPDPINMLRVLATHTALSNAARERREQAAIHAEIDALARRLPPAGDGEAAIRPGRDGSAA
jgi:hypothetical protein